MQCTLLRSWLYSSWLLTFLEKEKHEFGARVRKLSPRQMYLIVIDDYVQMGSMKANWALWRTVGKLGPVAQLSGAQFAQNR